MKISYGKNVYDNAEISAVLNQLKKTTQMGKSVAFFEKKIAKLFAKKYGLMVNSGSSALTLATKVLNFKKNDEIITPCLNFGTALSSIILSGAKPILIDINIETLQIDEKELEKKITKKTKAIMVPNLIGNIPNWKKIKQIANKYKLKIIEDSADTLGATINAKPTGIYSDISITSFYGSHIISCAGNGGMFMTNNKNFYEKAKVLRSWGRMSTLIKDSENIKKRLNIKLNGIGYDKKFVFSEVGYNFEPSEIGAAFGLVQLKKLKNNFKIREVNFQSHLKFVKKYEYYFLSPKIYNETKTAWLAFPLILKETNYFKRKDLMIYLEKNGIQTRVIFTGNILRQPGFKKIKCIKNKSYPNADYLMKNGILIGCHHGLNKSKIKYIQNKIETFLEKKINA